MSKKYLYNTNENTYIGGSMEKLDLNTRIIRKSERYTLFEVGSFLLRLGQTPTHWILSMGLKSYTDTFDEGFPRPYVTVFRVTKPCDYQQAVEKSNEFLSFFLQNAIDSFQE